MSTKIDPAIASRIDDVIQLRGMSYADVARKVDVTPATVWNWAKGRCAVSIERLGDIAIALDVSPAYLAFGLAESSEIPDPFIPVEAIPAELLEIPEYRYEKTPEPILVSTWRLSRHYVDSILNTPCDRLLIFKNPNKINGSLVARDRVLVSQCVNEEVLNEGYYLIFRPFVPAIVRLTVGYEKGLKYFITTPNSPVPQVFRPAEIVIIGEVVGSLKKSNFSF